VIDMALGVAIIRLESQREGAPASFARMWKNAAAGGVMVALVGAFVIQLDPMVLSATVFRKGQTRLHPDYELVSHVDGRTATVTVIHDTERPGYFTIFTNGKPDASVRTDRYPEGHDPKKGPLMSGDEPTQILVGMIPAMMKPHAKRWAMIGFGSGVSSDVLLASPELEVLDTIEIEPEMVRGSAAFDPLNRRTFNDPRSNLIFDDAKAFFAGTAGRYDVIVSEPSNPWVSGVASLFTVEFYQEIKRYLAPGGLVAQWIQGYELSDELLYSVLAAVDQEFEDYQVFRIGSRDWVIVARADGPIAPLDPAPLAEWEGFVDRGNLLGIHDAGQVHTLLAANKRMLHPFLSDQTPNRDVFPILDNGAERSRFFRSSAESLLALRWTPLPLLEVFGGVERMPYPERGIQDEREKKHILLEPEKARVLLARFETGQWRTGAAEMATWQDRNEHVTEGGGDWDAWFQATYEVYNLTASWVDLRGHPWWKTVVEVVREHEAPADVAQATMLLDALVQRDGPRIMAIVDEMRTKPNPHFDPRLVALSGAMGLELVDAPEDARRAFAREFMSKFGHEDDSDDHAFRVIRSYTAR
jgi:hypothetical protein